MVEYLVDSDTVEKESTNSMGRTARHVLYKTRDRAMIEKMGSKLSPSSVWSDLKLLELLSKKKERTMVVMTLIATMAFQSASSPPGGVWQEDTPSHRAGEAVIASTHPNIYKHLTRANTTAFVSSLMAIFLVAGPLRTGPAFLIVFSSYVMWVSLAAIAVSYGGSVLVSAPNTQTRTITQIINAVVGVSLGILGVMLLWNGLKACLRRFFGYRAAMDALTRLRFRVFSLVNYALCGLLTLRSEP